MMTDLIERLRSRNNKCLKCDGGYCNFCIERTEAADRIEELEAHVEALQNKCANRGLSPEDSDALQAENEKLRALAFDYIKSYEKLAFAKDRSDEYCEWQLERALQETDDD